MRAFVAVLSLVGLTACTPPPAATSFSAAPSWVHQFGGDGSDAARGVAVDADGNVYVVGETSGSLDGDNRGDTDAFLARYTPDGERAWVRQFGTAARDAANAVTVGRDGTIVVVGLTFGDLARPVRGPYDGFAARYDPDGRQRWLVQVGTDDKDLAGAVGTDEEGNVYLGGDTFGDLGGPNVGVADAYLAKLDPNGHPLWTRQLGTTAGEVVTGIAVDRDAVSVVGQTDGDLGGTHGGPDAFVGRYDRDGSRRWIRQLGTGASDVANAVTTGAGTIVIAGGTEGDLYGPLTGQSDAFVATLDATGNPVRGHQFGATGVDQANAVTAGPDGTVYVAGHTDGDLGRPSAGSGDAFLAAYGSDGRPLWTRQFGAAGNDTAKGVAASADSVYVVGLTAGGLDGTTGHGFDAFIARYPAAGHG